MGRARRASEALAKLAPERATVRRDGKTEDVAVEALEIGDIILVRPNERIAADGVVVAGDSSVNQAPVTGESVPVDKRASADRALDFAKASAEYRVFAGTINGTGALDIRVARKAGESTLARVVRMVAEAEKYAQEDDAQKKKIEAKNGLENYAYSLRNSSNDEKLKDKIDAADKETLEGKVKETIEWLDNNQSGEVEEYEEKQKELEGVAMPIMQKLYAAGGGALGSWRCGASGAAQLRASFGA